jgi:hypothetical protein
VINIQNRILVNINLKLTHAVLPVTKAISILNKLRKATDAEIVIVGSTKELPHVNAVI